MIMEQHSNYTIVLTPDGEFIKAKKILHHNVGDIVTFECDHCHTKEAQFMLKPFLKVVATTIVILCMVWPIIYVIGQEPELSHDYDIDPNGDVITFDDRLHQKGSDMAFIRETKKEEHVK